VTTPERFLVLAGAHNFRDLGGLPTVDGRRTRHRVLYRADGLGGLTAADVEALRDLGLKTVLDLRWADEVERDGRCPVESITYVNLPLFPNPTERPPDSPDRSIDFGGYYLWALELVPENAAEAFRTIASAELPLVFHCTAGKDRTGVLSALVLGCAGVTPEAIVEDYARTDERMEAIVAKLRANPAYGERIASIPAEVFSARPETMRRFLDLVEERYGGPRAWASSVGIDDSTIDALASRLVA
jgi:protein tyrosine/serine phosphatase